MIYKAFGKTGLKVSALGFGCMRFPVTGKNNRVIDEEHATRMVHHAIENGVNYFDTAYPYHAENFSKRGSSPLESPGSEWTSTRQPSQLTMTKCPSPNQRSNCFNWTDSGKLAGSQSETRLELVPTARAAQYTNKGADKKAISNTQPE